MSIWGSKPAVAAEDIGISYPRNRIDARSPVHTNTPERFGARHLLRSGRSGVVAQGGEPVNDPILRSPVEPRDLLSRRLGYLDAIAGCHRPSCFLSLASGIGFSPLACMLCCRRAQLRHAPSDPCLDFGGEPADSPWTQMDRPREAARCNGRVDCATPQTYQSLDLPSPEELSRIFLLFHDSKLNHGIPQRHWGLSRELRPTYPLLMGALLSFCALCVLLLAFQDIAHPLVGQLRPTIPPLGERFSVVSFSQV